MNLNGKTTIYKNPIAVPLLALLTCFLWGSAFPTIKVGFELFNITDTGSKILFAGYRFFCGGLLALLIVSIVEKRFVTISLKTAPYVAIQGFLQTTAQYICFYIGLSYTTSSKGSIINGANAFISIIVAHFLYKNGKYLFKNDRMNLRKVIGCIIGFLGVILINYDGSSLLSGWSLKGEGLVMLCTTVYGISTVTLRVFTQKENPNAIAAYQLLFGSTLLLILGFALGGHVEGFTLKSTLLFAYLVLIPAVSFVLWGNLLKHNSVGKISIFGFSISIFGVILSSIFLHEQIFNFTTLTSLLLVCAGIIIVNKRKKNS